MYQFVDGTYNPIKGACTHDCKYCYMISMRQRFRQDPTLRLDEKELARSLGSGKHYFVGSSTDDFAANVPSDWITRVLDHLNEYQGNIYQLQSKNPKRFLEFIDHPLFGDKSRVVFCTTLESDTDYSDISQAPSMNERVKAMHELSMKGFRTMVTVEPIMKFASPEHFADMIAACGPEQVNIGVNTSRTVKLPEPTKEEFAAFVAELAKRNLNIHYKNNMDRIKK